jgi:hypothetical protein
MRPTAVALATTLFFGTVAPAWVSAQGSIVGKYTGSIVQNFATSGAVRAIGLQLVVDSAEGGVVKGTATILELNCAGDYPMEGKLDDGKLQLRSTTKGGRAGDCWLRLALSVEGNKLNGTTGSGQQVQLSKR